MKIASVRWLLIPLAFSSCDPPPVPYCPTSPCGAVVYVTDAKWLEGFVPEPELCARFVAAEAVGVEVFGAAACTAMAGVEVSLRGPGHNTDGGFWRDEWMRHVAGLMSCAGDESGAAITGMVLLRDDFTTNAYFHELAHVLECPTADSAHSTWNENGTYSKISKAQSMLVTPVVR